MASEESRAGRRMRTVLSDNDINNALNNSDIDFSGDDSDEDPAYSPPEIFQMTDQDSSSSSDENEDGSQVSIPSPAVSCDSEILTSTTAPRVQIRGRARSTSRRGRGRICTRRIVNLRSQSSPSLRLNDNLQEQVEDKWAADKFDPEMLNFTLPAYCYVDTSSWDWSKYYDQYIDDKILLTIVECTNRTHILETGKSLGLTLKELKTYLGITMVMSALQYPQIDMYWLHKWKIPVIAMAMNRNRFYFIRKRLKCVYDPEVTSEQRKEKIWKIKPLFDRILEGCHMQERPKDLCIDEMIIPFTGRCSMRQYCPGKPNPVGLKVFVLASPQGVVCDMSIYQGDTTFPEQKSQGFGLGESAVLFLTRTLVPGHSLYFDRYFTTVKLCDELLKHGFYATGTVMKNRIPRECVLNEERLFRKEERGSTEVKIREGGNLAITRWLDNKPVLIMSSRYSNENQDECERWSKKDNRYAKVTRPEVIKKYNENMGGVDLTDRMLSVCPSRNRTKKWTIRVISHLFDLCVVNSWIQYRAEEKQKGTLKKNIMQLRKYKLELGTKLITDNENQSDDEIDQVYEELEPKHKKRRIVVKPIPTRECRQQHADHLPEYSTEKQHRCRKSGCDKRTTVFCRKCDVFLCFVPARNCFSQFHKNDS